MPPCLREASFCSSSLFWFNDNVEKVEYNDTDIQYLDLLDHPLLTSSMEVERHQPLPTGVHGDGDDGCLVV